MDRKVPVSLIFAIVVQTAAIIWWGSDINTRVNSLERTDVKVEALITQRIKLADDRYDGLLRERDRIVRVEEQIKALVDIVRRIDAKLDTRQTPH